MPFFKLLLYQFLISLLIVHSGCTSTQPEKHPLTLESTYTVRSGDTLYSIARRHGKTVEKIAELNQLKPPYPLYPGQVLTLTPVQKRCSECKRISPQYQKIIERASEIES